MGDATAVASDAALLLGSTKHGGGPFWDQLKIDAGNAAFTLTTDTTVEVTTTLTTCIAATLTPLTIAATAGDDALYCDLGVTSSKITVGRDQAVADNLGFSYIFIGS